MSWFATKYAWKVTAVGKSAKMVLLALAFRIPHGYSSTEPTSLGLLEELTGYDPRHLRRCLDELAQVGEVVRLTRGKLATYHFQNMEGPLFARTVKADNMSAFSQQSTPEEPDVVSENSADNTSGKNRTQGPPAGGVPFCSEVLSTEVLATTSSEEEVDRFLNWFLQEYPKHRGVLYRVIGTPKAVEQAVRDVFEGRTFAHVQAMAIAMWADRVEPWLNDPKQRNDRGIFSLRHKSTYLDALVAEAQRERADDYGHIPPCHTRQECVARMLDEERQKRAAVTA